MPEAIFQPQKFAILSYGIQTEFLAYIVLDDVIRVATLFFSEITEGYPQTPDSSEGLIPRAIICYMGIDP